MQQPILPESVNAIGIASIIALVVCWIVAAISGLVMFRNRARRNDAASLWKEPGLHRFFAFCAAGLICGIIAFAFGGWPTGYE